MTGQELEKIYNEAYKPVYWTAMQFLKSESAAEDVVQDTFIAFMRSYGDRNDIDNAVALLKKIAANRCLNRIRLEKTDIMDEEFFDNVEAVPEDFLPDSIIESDDSRRIIMDIISSSLSEDIRRTLILFYFDEMSTKEIAEALGVPEGTVRRRLNFARNKIKKEVEKYEEDNNTKLFGMAIPFLSKLFIKESEQVMFKPMPATLANMANLSASAEAPANGAIKQASREVIKKGTDIMKTKILIGSVAGIVAVGATVGIIIGIANSKNDKVRETKRPAVTEEQEEDVSEMSNDAATDITAGSETVTAAASDTETTGDTTSDTTAETEPVIVRAASVPEEDIVYVNMEGMTAEQIIHNIDNVSRMTDTCNRDNFGDRFQVVEPYEVWNEANHMLEFTADVSYTYNGQYLCRASLQNTCNEINFQCHRENMDEVYEYYYNILTGMADMVTVDTNEATVRSVIAYIGEDRYKVQVTFSSETALFRMEFPAEY